MIKSVKNKIIVQEQRKKDRRIKCDPRYRNRNYPEFVEQRAAGDRRCGDDCVDHSLLNKIGSHHRFVTLFGAIIITILLYIFLLGVYKLKTGLF